MSETPPQSPAERAEQAATRRRWITLAEFVAVAGLIIAAVTLYLNWSDRRQDLADKAQQTATDTKAKGVVTLTGEVGKDGETMKLEATDHDFSAAVVRFPKQFGIAEQDAMPGPRIDAGWFDDTLLKLAGKNDKSGRLPVLITVSWWDGAAKRQDTARYDILWASHGRLIGGRKLTLTGLTLADRSVSTVALEAAWSEAKPKP